MKLKYIFLLLSVSFAFTAKSQVVDFTWSTTDGLYCSPQTVTFTQNCTGNPGGFIWNFGNGHSNVHPSDTTRYTAPGTYTVTLIGLYADTAIVKTKTITINPTPTVTLTSNTTSICQPGNISFTATGNSLVSFDWNFGDGSPVQTTSVGTVTHHFNNYGMYTVRVKGTTVFGCSADYAIVVSVKEFAVTGDIGPKEGCIPMSAFLTVNAAPVTPDAVQSYTWNFGDGSPVVTNTNSFLLHTYNITTPITPHVTVTSVSGCVTEFDMPQVAYGTPPTNIHAFTVSGRDTFCGNENIAMHAMATNATGFHWDFGDGTDLTLDDQPVNYQYSDTGWYHVVVTSLFHGCRGAKDSFDIYVEGVVAKFKCSNTCTNKNTFLFSNTSSGHINRYEWNFSDDISIQDSVHFNVTHTFPLTGDHLVTLMLRDSLTGCADTATATIYLAQPILTRSKASVCKDSLMTYTVSQTYNPASGVSYHFFAAGNNIDNFGDSVLNHHALNHGIFSDLVIIDHNNPDICKDTLRLTPPTRVTGPVTDFTAAPLRVCLKIPVVLTNNTHPFFPADNIVTWAWDFRDGQSVSVQNPPAHLYTSPGTYNISLIATDVLGCALKKEVEVIVDPIPEITVYPRKDTICQNRDTAILSAYTIDPFVWTQNLHISCNTCDTIKAWPPVTTYYVATATNAGGCSNTDTSFIRVYAPFHTVVSPTNISVCPKVSVPFNVATAGVTLWIPPDYLNNPNIPNPVANAESSVLYKVAVTDSAGCYSDTALVHLNINPLPTVNAGPDRRMAYGTAFTLDPAYSSDVQSYVWTPAGNLDCTNCAKPKGTAERTITHTVEVTSDKGCKATDDIVISLLCEKAGLYMPSAFTPFNGGGNNYFYPLAKGYKTINSFLIYNRLGNKVFERKNFDPNIASLGWDGKIYGDNSHSTEAFVWYVEAVCEQGETVTAKGTVLLVR